MTYAKKLATAATAFAVLASTAAHAISIGGFDPIKAATKIVTAPTNTVINAVKVVVNGDSAKTILDPAKDAAKSVAPLPALAANVATWPNEQLFKEAQALAAKTGKAGEFVFDIASFQQRYHDQIVKSSGTAAANALVGKNPLEFLAMPLAAAIREARARHIASAKPLPDDVKKALFNFFPKEVLDRARYAVGTVEITLPNGIGKVQKFFGNDFGVVVDDVIVFSKDPGTFRNDPQWWGHEVTHIKQYMDWGVEEFAFRYVKSLGNEVESPAYARGDEVLAWARQNFRGADGSAVALVVASAHSMAGVQAEPLLPPAYVKAQDDQAAAAAQADPPIIRCIFPNDALEYYGTQNGRIIVVDRAAGRWLHIGWAAPPDIAGPAWVYFIPGRGSYDVFANGQIVQRITPSPYGPFGPPGPPVQVGYVARLQ